jgi:hypothetical protein
MIVVHNTIFVKTTMTWIQSLGFNTVSTSTILNYKTFEFLKLSNISVVQIQFYKKRFMDF